MQARAESRASHTQANENVAAFADGSIAMDTIYLEGIAEDGDLTVFGTDSIADSLPQDPPQPEGRIGTLLGVFIPCLLNILGVALFLRLGWVIGNAGLGLTSLIIIITSAMTTITTLSMSALCTNRELLHGGPYYLISRSIGPRIGGSVGILWVFGQAFTVSMYCVAFAEAWCDIFAWSNPWALRGTAFVLLLILSLITMAGFRWVIQLQLVLLLLLAAAVVSYFVGTFTTAPDSIDGFTGYASSTLAGNIAPQFTAGPASFFFVFAVYFPAASGILASTGISGELRNPSVAIPKGTLSAVAVSTILSFAMAWTLGAIVLRPTLIEDYLVMRKISVFGLCVLMGIFAASVSCALSSLTSAPYALHVLASDGILPLLHFLGSLVGRECRLRWLIGQPLRAFAVVLVLAAAGIFVGRLNAIAPLVTMCTMVAYAMLNYACFASASGDARLSWNPTFRYYNRWVSLLGCIASFAFMFVVEWISALVALALAIALYVYIRVLDVPVPYSYARFHLGAYLMEKMRATRARLAGRRPSAQSASRFSLGESSSASTHLVVRRTDEPSFTPKTVSHGSIADGPAQTRSTIDASPPSSAPARRRSFVLSEESDADPASPRATRKPSKTRYHKIDE